MLKHIGTFGKFLMLISIFIGRFSYAQIFVSPNACISNLSTDSDGNSTGCEEAVQFFDTDPNSTSRVWNFGDPSAPLNITSRSANYAYKQAGTFTVRLTKFIGSVPQTPITQTFVVGNRPSNTPLFNGKEKNEITVCDGKTLTLDPYKGISGFNANSYDYLWFPNGETTPTIDVTESGCYSVEVFDKTTRCSKTAQIKVTFCLQDPKSSGGSEKWYLGNKSELEFELSQTPVPVDNQANTGPVFDTPQFEDPSYSPVPNTSSPNPMNTIGSPAMVYGPSGALMFYTDGNRVYDTDNFEIQGSPLGFANNTTQGVIIIPKPVCNECEHHKYMVVGIDPIDNILKYSIIDTRLNNGKGGLENIAGVVTKIPILMPPSERINAVLNSEETGYILVAPESNSTQIHTFLIDQTGVKDKITFGSVSLNSPESLKGSMVFNSSAEFMAQSFSIGTNNYIEIFRLNNDANAINNLTYLYTLNLASLPNYTTQAQVYGLAFSGSTDYLYVSLNGTDSYLYQLNLRDYTNPAVIVSNAKLISYQPLGYGSLQYGPTNGDGDKYLYLSINAQNYISYIQESEILPISNTPYDIAIQLGFSLVSLTDKGVSISGNTNLGFPLVIHAKPKQDGAGISATYSGNCFGRPTILEIEPVCSPLVNNITWEFPDGTKESGQRVSHFFKKDGLNQIKVTIEIKNPPPTGLPNQLSVIASQLTTPCNEKVITDEIYIRPSPQFNFDEVTYICTATGDNLNLKANVTGGGAPFFYNWMTGSGTSLGVPNTQDFYTNLGTGQIKLEVTNSVGCKVDDITEVDNRCEPVIFLPDIFSPNDDKINDELSVIARNVGIFELSIYNRWGELIFSSNDPNKKWNGEIKDRTIYPIVCPYIIKYTNKFKPLEGPFYTKGTIMVIK